MLLGAALLCIGSATADAAAGDHIRVGDATVIPSISLGAELRSNAYRQEIEPKAGANLLISTGVEIVTEGADVQMDLAAHHSLRKYFKPSLVALDRLNDFDLHAGLHAMKDRTVGLEISDQAFLYNDVGEGSFHTRLFNDLSGEVVVRAGQAIEIRLGGGFLVDDYRTPGAAQYDGNHLNRKTTGNPKFGAKWAFFPRTAFVLDAEYQMNRWERNWLDATGQQTNWTSDVGNILGMPDSNHFKISGGLRGRVTPRLVLATLLGFGSADYQEQSVVDDTTSLPAGTLSAELDGSMMMFDADVTGLEHLLGLLQVEYNLSEKHRIRAGYRKDFRDVFFTNYLSFHQFYLTATDMFGPRFQTKAGFSAFIESYKGELPSFAARDDVYLKADLNLSYLIQEWASVDLGLGWVERASTDNYVEFDDFIVQLSTVMTY